MLSGPMSHRFILSVVPNFLALLSKRESWIFQRCSLAVPLCDWNASDMLTWVNQLCLQSQFSHITQLLNVSVPHLHYN